MRHFSTRAAVLSSAVLSLLLPATAQVSIEPGFELVSSLPAPSVFGAHATLSDGRLFDFDGQTFSLYDAAGGFLADLGSLPAPVFASFALADPSETFVVVGESSAGDLYAVDLSGAGFSLVAAGLTFNFDAAFDPLDPTRLWVSAALGGFGAGNDLLRLDLTTGQSDVVAHVAGPSGPLALDAAGDLYYVTQSDAFPPPPGSLSLIAWTRAQLESGVLLDESVAEVVRSGLDGGSDLAFGPVWGNLFLSGGLSSGGSQVLELDPASGAAYDVVATSPTALGKLELFAAGGSGTFHAYQPQNVQLVARDTDFGTFTSELLRVEPRRPVASLAGPTQGPAAKTLTVTGAEPDSAVLVTWGSILDVLGSEIALDLGWGAPFHSVLAPGFIRRQPFLTPTDSSGTATWSYFDPGNLHGTLSFQVLVRGSDGGFEGSSTAVQN